MLHCRYWTRNLEMHAVAGSSFCLCSKDTRTYRTLTRKFPLLSLILPPLKSSPCMVISFNLGHCLMFPGPCSEMENNHSLPKGLPCGCQNCCVLAQGSLMPQSVHVLHSQTHELPKKSFQTICTRTRLLSLDFSFST